MNSEKDKTKTDDEKLIEAWEAFKKEFLKPFVAVLEWLSKKFPN